MKNKKEFMGIKASFVVAFLLFCIGCLISILAENTGESRWALIGFICIMLSPFIPLLDREDKV